MSADSYATMLAAVQAFHDKHGKLDKRDSRMVDGRIRVSEFHGIDQEQ